MQYNGYEIQTTDSCYIIRDSKGNYISSTANSSEAKEYIDELIADEDKVYDVKKTDWYEKFDKYCKNLPGKCYPTEDRTKFGTTNQNVLRNFIKSFEENTHTKVEVKTAYLGDEYFYIVTNVYAM